MTLKAAIFDWDGTITDSNDIKTRAFIDMFADCCNENEIYIAEYQRTHGGISRFEKYRHYVRRFSKREVSAEELEKFGRDYAELCYQKLLQAPFVSGAIETLECLSERQIPAFVVTGSPAEEIYGLAAARNISGLITEIFGSPKTKEVLLAELLQKYDLKPMDVVFFGDSLIDCYAARSVDIPFVGVLSGGSPTAFPDETTTLQRIKIDFNNSLRLG